MRICFDMDGTIADLYGVDNWLEKLIAYDESPYLFAKTLLNMSVLARMLNKLQKNGYEIGIISWLSKNSTSDYNEKVTAAKQAWLKRHLKSVQFDFITIVDYGTDKNIVRMNDNDILFDDELKNRENWGGIAYDVNNIIEILKNLKKSA